MISVTDIWVCYWKVSTSGTWLDGLGECEAAGGTLAILKTEDAQNVVINQIFGGR